MSSEKTTVVTATASLPETHDAPRAAASSSAHASPMGNAPIRFFNSTKESSPLPVNVWSYICSLFLSQEDISAGEISFSNLYDGVHGMYGAFTSQETNLKNMFELISKAIQFKTTGTWRNRETHICFNPDHKVISQEGLEQFIRYWLTDERYNSLHRIHVKPKVAGKKDYFLELDKGEVSIFTQGPELKGKKGDSLDKNAAGIIKFLSQFVNNANYDIYINFATPPGLAKKIKSKMDELSTSYNNQMRTHEADKLRVIVEYFQLFIQLQPFYIIPIMAADIMLNRLLYENGLPLSIQNNNLYILLFHSLDQAIAAVREGQQRFLHLFEGNPLRFPDANEQLANTYLQDKIGRIKCEELYKMIHDYYLKCKCSLSQEESERLVVSLT